MLNLPSLSLSTKKHWKKLASQIFDQGILQNKWIPHKPTSKQAEFLALMCTEAFYGGAAGGGKSDALLMGALQFAEIPYYSAILFRKTYADLSLPGALMDRAREWIGNKAHWDGQTYTFPSRATLTFGYLQAEKDKFRYQSAEFQYIGFDELTQFTESQYRFLFSRLRRLKVAELAYSYIPLRMRGASNPGNIGHDWVKQRFLIEGEQYGRVFVPAKLSDNPYLDQEKYIQSLNNLDPITRRQFLEGDWTAKHGGSLFQRQWFEIITTEPAPIKKVRFWDKAATKPRDDTDPDYTVGVLLGYRDGVYVILDVKRIRAPPPQVEALIKQTAKIDGVKIPIFMEQEPGSSGVESIYHYARYVLQGYAFRGVKTTGSKAERANPVSSAAEAGNFRILQAGWNSAFLDELEAFPLGGHDDQVDALSGAFAQFHKAQPNPSFKLI